MTEFFDSLTKYWPVITWFIAMIFGMGIMWVKVDTSQRAFRKLFEQMDEANKFIAGQVVQNDGFKERMEKLAEESKEHAQDDSIKFGELRGRIDQIFALLTKGAQ
ncbi:MAG: hypothetical protein U1E51_17710 [Candidatus Binatia bacterium]|nr:hypothetical protein [Candidatus Binatia bacterium]